MSEEIIGIIGGTGIGQRLAEKFSGFEEKQIETPYGKCSDKILLGKLWGKKVAFINRHGNGHILSPSEVPYAANIYALKQLGVRSLIATAAVGSLEEDIHPTELVIVDQFIDKTFKRRNTFFENKAVVHVEFAQPTCLRMKKLLLETAEKFDIKLHRKGTYVCMEGPAFSSRAESLMHKSWGGDLIGMTAMPEAKLAREAQMCYMLVAMVSDYDCWKVQHAELDKQTLIKEIMSNLKHGSDNAIALIEALIKDQPNIGSEECPCRKSLELAVLTSEDKVRDKQNLSVLFE